MTRIKPPNRRYGYTETIDWRGRKYEIGFYQHEGRICDCFCSATTSLRTGADDQTIISDACVAISKLLQHGESIVQVAEGFGEDRNPGETDGPPSSLLGAVAWAGVEIQRALDEGSLRPLEVD